MAVQFAGNDHVIEFNDVHHVCLESNDAGAVYSGRDWTWRGTVIRFNKFWEITGFEDRGCVGVYLDDMLCGTHVHGNLFWRVTRATVTVEVETVSSKTTSMWIVHPVYMSMHAR
jgi:hypothetical protein